MNNQHLQHIRSKIVNIDKAIHQVNSWKNKGLNVVFTNGCFDILHKGHVTYLAKSADLGEKLIIGLNSDNSVRRQGKGENRPINQEDSRALLLASLTFVDLVVIYDEDTPIEVIQALNPDILVKGADYDENEMDASKKTYIVGSDVMRENGGEVKTIALEEGFSTTNIIHKIKKND